MIAFGEEVSGKLDELENREARLKEFEGDLAKVAATYREAAQRLSEQRASAAKKLAKLAEKQINELAMNAKFAVDVSAEEAESSWSASGWDRVEARIATNPGEPMKPLEEIASGGEMSRVMLALKVAVEEGASVE